MISDELYHDFMELHKHYVHQQDDEAQMAHEFENYTRGHHQFYKTKLNLSEEEQKISVMFQEESNTWRLLRALKRDHPVIDEQMNPTFSEDQLIANFYLADKEVRRMQLVCDWLEANMADELDYKEEEDKVEFYTEGPIAWENTFHAMKAKYNIDIPDLDITMNPNSGVELCDAMDPDAPIRTKKALANSDKEVEMKLYKHVFKHIRAGQLDEGQKLAQRVNYFWLSAILDGWLPYSDPNLDEENLGLIAVHQPSDIQPISGNKKRNIWKQTCYKSAKIHGLSSCEKALLGLFGGNLKAVLPVCNTWADQLWARLRCSIDVKIEQALRDIIPQENQVSDFPQEFYDNYQGFEDIFSSIRDLKIVSPFKEATIQQTVQKHLILNDIEGLLNQLAEWCETLDYDINISENDRAVSPHFLRFFAHLILFLRETGLVTANDDRGTKIIEAYINLLTQRRSTESVAHYAVFLPHDNQIVSFAKLLALIEDKQERQRCLQVAKESKLDIDEITQTVVELIRDQHMNLNTSALDNTKTDDGDKKKIDALDYLLCLEKKNFIAILHHGNILLRQFALAKKMDALRETYLKLPQTLGVSVEAQWRLHTNSDITVSLKNNIRELDCFRALLEVQEELTQWSEWHRKKPEEPRKPANLSKFCDNVNYEQRLKQYQQDLHIWNELREKRTNSLVDKITKMFQFSGGWMKDLPTDESLPNQEDRQAQMIELRKYFIPHMTTICFNVLQLTNRHDDCLKVSHLLANEELKLYEDFTKVQIRAFLAKISEVTKTIVRQLVNGQQ